MRGISQQTWGLERASWFATVCPSKHADNADPPMCPTE
jgi:hypothetical protein